MPMCWTQGMRKRGPAQKQQMAQNGGKRTKVVPFRSWQKTGRDGRASLLPYVPPPPLILSINDNSQ